MERLAKPDFHLPHVYSDGSGYRLCLSPKFAGIVHITPEFANRAVHPPQSQRVLSAALMLTGLVIAAIAILADTINIGTGKGFGYYQMIVLIAGIVIFLIGIAVIIGDRSHGSSQHQFTPDDIDESADS